MDQELASVAERKARVLGESCWAIASTPNVATRVNKHAEP